jgi:hypothetical protein
MKKRWYLGYRGWRFQPFSSAVEPTSTTHGEYYSAVVGPFRTKRAAFFMAENPMVLTVSDAEELCKCSA